MPESHLYLFRGQTDARGVPLEWLDKEPATAPGPGPNPGDPDTPGTPVEDAIPARHLSQSEYDALSPRNKERVLAAKNAYGDALYERDTAPAGARTGRAADGGKE